MKYIYDVCFVYKLFLLGTGHKLVGRLIKKNKRNMEIDDFTIICCYV